MTRLLAILAWVVAAGSGAADVRSPFLHPAEPSGPPAVGKSQRFVFRGFSREDGTHLAVWTEGVAGQVERRLGGSIPFRRFEMIRVDGVNDGAEPGGRILVGRGFVEGSLQQRVVLLNPHGLGEEALLEGMVQVLLTRYIAVNQGAGTEVGAGALVPDWLAVGVAQGLREGLRQRNRAHAAESWKAGTMPTAAAVLGWKTLPQGYAARKAFCSLLVDWLEQAVGPAFWPKVLEACARGEDVDGKWVSRLLPGVDDEPAVNRAWDVWLAESVAPRAAGGAAAAAAFPAGRLPGIGPGGVATTPHLGEGQ